MLKVQLRDDYIVNFKNESGYYSLDKIYFLGRDMVFIIYDNGRQKKRVRMSEITIKNTTGVIKWKMLK